MAIAKIDLSPERKDWKDAEFGEEVRAAGISSLQKTEDVINGTVNAVNQAAENVEDNAQAANAAVAVANSAVSNSNTALANVEAVRKDINGRVAAGEFKGDKGDKGDTGAQGTSGVTAPASGMFSLYLDSATGNLYADYPDGETPPAFEYETDTGNLYYVTG